MVPLIREKVMRVGKSETIQDSHDLKMTTNMPQAKQPWQPQYRPLTDYETLVDMDKLAAIDADVAKSLVAAFGHEIRVLYVNGYARAQGMQGMWPCFAEFTTGKYRFALVVTAGGSVDTAAWATCNGTLATMGGRAEDRAWRVALARYIGRWVWNRKV